jgi:DNA-binding CsgD family transcriptional regulator
MAGLLLTVHLTSVVLGFIVLIMSIYIGLRFKIKALAFFIALQLILIFNLTVVLVYREGMKFGWTLAENQFYLLKRMIYVFLSCTISIVYLFFNYLIFQTLQRWKRIAGIVLQVIYILIVFSPFFEISSTRTPLWGYYVYNILLFAQFVWTYIQILTHRKLAGNKNMVRMVNIYLAVAPVSMAYYYFLEYSGRFLHNTSAAMGYSLPFPLLFIIMNIALIVYGFTRFTVQPVEISGTSYYTPELMEKYSLSGREAEIMKYLCDGLSNRETGEKLFISELTVKTHVQNIYRKLGVKNRLELLDKVPHFKK